MTTFIKSVMPPMQTGRRVPRASRSSFQTALKNQARSMNPRSEVRPSMAPPQRGVARSVDMSRFQGRLTELESQLRGLLDEGKGQVVQGRNLSTVLQLIEQLQASQKEPGGQL